MTRLLSIANKLLSLRGAILITDASGDVVYEGRGAFALFSPTWTLWHGGRQVATLRRRIFAIRPTWDVTGELGEFQFRNKLFSFTRKITVEGGPYAGATINGNLWDLRFAIEQAGRTIATSAGKILTLRDRHNVELLSDAPADELFTVLAMMAIQLERRAAERERASSGE